MLPLDARTPDRRLHRLVLGALSVLALLVLAQAAQAKNSILKKWQEIYPQSLSDENVAGAGSSCLLCHSNTSWDYNGYGWKIREYMDAGSSDAEAIGLAGTFDSDGDPAGATSHVESLGSTQPGYTAGPNNTYYSEDGPPLTNQMPLPGILGNLDPPSCGVTATATPYGAGKPGTNGVPTLTSTSPPVLGGTADLTIANGYPGATALMFFGLSQTSVPFDGGTLLVTPLLTLTLPLDASGGIVLPVPLPADTALCGFQGYFQVMFQDPGATGFNQSAQTAGLAWTIGA